MLSKNELDKVKDTVQRDYPKSRLILYGSRARKDSKEDSDWDLLILLKNRISTIEKNELLDKLYDLELEFEEVISPLIHYENDWRALSGTEFYSNIQKEGMLL